MENKICTSWMTYQTQAFHVLLILWRPWKAACSEHTWILDISTLFTCSIWRVLLHLWFIFFPPHIVIAPVPLSCCYSLSAPPHFFSHLDVASHSPLRFSCVFSRFPLSVLLPSCCSVSLSVCLWVCMMSVWLHLRFCRSKPLVGVHVYVLAHTDTHTYMGMCDLISSHLRFSKSDSSQGYL